MELSPNDRSLIQQQIAEYKPAPVAVVTSLTGTNATDVVHNVIEENKTPDRQEERKIKRRVRGLWKTWRTTALDAKALEVEQFACQIAVERANTNATLAAIKRKEEIERLNHWLIKNTGNLKEIKYNTESKPSMFWYYLNRGIYHIKQTTSALPGIVVNMLKIGAIVAIFLLVRKYVPF